MLFYCKQTDKNLSARFIGKDIQQAQHLHKWLMIGWEKLMIKKIAGEVLLDFSAAFDIIDHSLLLEKHPLL